MDRHYLKRQKKKILAQVKKKEEESMRSIEGLYFDGRKDESVNLKVQGGKLYQTKSLVEHLVLVEEPDSRYLGFVTPKSGTAISI